MCGQVGGNWAPQPWPGAHLAAGHSASESKKTLFLLGLVGESMSSRLCSDRTDKCRVNPGSLCGIKRERWDGGGGRCATSGEERETWEYVCWSGWSQAKYLMFLTETWRGPFLSLNSDTKAPGQGTEEPAAGKLVPAS